MSAQFLSGLDLLLRRIAGDDPSPNYDEAQGIVLVAAKPGWVSMSATASTQFANASGAMHGGWIAGLLDTASGAAVQSVLAAGEAYTTLVLQTNYLRAVLPATTVRVEGSVARAGGRVVTAEAKVFCGEDVCAAATATCLRLTAR